MEDAGFTQILLLGLLMVVGFIAGAVGERLSIPRVAIYVVVGALFSGDLLGRFLPAELGPWSDTLTDLALELIAFIVGAELELRWFKTGAFADHASLILNTVLGSTIVFELISPYLAKQALARAGETGKREE
ncbi:MAG: hypothetical protein GF331_01430 [Chitinivibrionales bacterium]|nr:hypothetical protein [Chitinivibrionales bacterium]